MDLGIFGLNASGSQIGLENRSNILPTEPPKGMDFLGPNYNYGDEIFRPKAIGVKRDDTFDSVTAAIKGMAYYICLLYTSDAADE